MRKSMTAGIFGGFVFALIAGAVMVPVQETMKLGFIDSQAVIGAYPPTQDAQATFATENTVWERQAAAMEAEFNRLNQDLERQSLAMTPERRAQLGAEVQQKYGEYQAYVDEIWGQTGQAYERNQELMAPIIEKVNTLLEQVGEDEGYDYIFDAASGGLVYAAPAYDLTPHIIELMGTGTDEPDLPQAP
jgi:outer membrane protein